MGKRAARARLGIRRETLRRLSGREMANVAGGDWVATAQMLTVDSTIKCDPDTCPKTNAWTAGGDDIDAVCHA